MKKEIVLYILILFSLFSCINKENSEKYTENLLDFKYTKDSVFVFYNDSLVFGDIDKRKFNRDSIPKSIIYNFNKVQEILYLYNFGGGMNALFLKKNYSVNKKLPLTYNTSKTIGNEIHISKNRVLLSNKMYAVIYDTELNELFFPLEYISHFDNHKYGEIMEADYKIIGDSLKAHIRYYENWETGKDTIFRFHLYNGFPTIQ
jgi:hypothetical protein